MQGKAPFKGGSATGFCNLTAVDGGQGPGVRAARVRVRGRGRDDGTGGPPNLGQDRTHTAERATVQRAIRTSTEQKRTRPDGGQTLKRETSGFFTTTRTDGKFSAPLSHCETGCLSTDTVGEKVVQQAVKWARLRPGKPCSWIVELAAELTAAETANHGGTAPGPLR